VSEEPAGPDERPPLLGSWRNVYALVLFALAATVVLLYALARWAA
jgi:hypothetical protein